jgi:hypothetical protein
MSRVREALRVELELRDLFEAPTVRRLARSILARPEGAASMATGHDRIRPRTVDGPAPLSFAQQRLWFFDQYEPGSSAYTLASTILLRGELDISALRGSFAELVKRHEVMRTTFGLQKGQPVQMIAEHAGMPLTVQDLPDHHPDNREFEFERFVSEERNLPFDLGQAPLCRAKLVRLSADEYGLILTMHHIVTDAWSMNILVEELAALYRALLLGDSADLRDLPIQYADFAL